MPERSALVTGGSSGIGLAIAHVLVEEGYEVTVAGRNPERLERTVAALGQRANGIADQLLS